MITRVQYPVDTKNIAFGNIASKGCSQGSNAVKTVLSENNKTGIFTTLKDIFFEMFPILDAQYRKQMGNVKKIDKLI
ncbi:MAG: hypothetical protein K2F57_00935 [Candidatus Gastranaerophilales bacterium]|nr:hypothetical protein [Candidatus Gastranaerophilales bacterium]